MATNVPVSGTNQRYSSLAEAYIELFGNVEQAEPEDQELIRQWATRINGPVLDAGCGPGQWTQFLQGPDRPATGIDLVPEFLEFATARYPECTFRQADMAQLPFSDHSFSAILAWYSIIHTPPQELANVLNSLARVLKPGGQLLIGFFAAEQLQPFDHKVAPAWYWPVDELSTLLENAGFIVVDHGTRERPGARRHGHIMAELKVGPVIK
ncbi:class I SAM-dependent methyltransferase [Glutamicibacter sp.]|uniref:class I SAM-dependent methyltransferase n=1 Tax=Glutamicibacter sp. TaxID=1931995 RepID=UPI002FE29821